MLRSLERFLRILQGLSMKPSLRSNPKLSTLDPLSSKPQTLIINNHQPALRERNIGALIVTYTILGVPYCSYSIIYPKTLF